MKKSVLLLILLLIWFVDDGLYACTVFMSTNEKCTLVGSNEDYKRSDSQIFIIPPKDGKYGHALFGYNGSVQAGINEKGLFWDGLRAYPYITLNNTNNKPNIDGNVLYKILEECARLDEVIKLFETFHWDGFQLSQLMVVDKTGESAIITCKQDGLVITKREKPYQVCANFRISCKEDMENYHWYDVGSKRFNKAEKGLRNQKLTVANCFSILKATCQNNIFAKTIYSTVFNLNTGDIYLSINGNFSRTTTINLKEELKKGRFSYFLSDLVNSTNENRKKIEIRDEKYLTSNSGKLLLDKEWKLTDKQWKADYYRTIEKDSISDHYVMRDFFMDGTLQGVAFYSSLNPEIIDGDYYEYHENGTVKVVGYFGHRLKMGEWSYWSKEGKLEKSVRYVNGIGQ